MSSPDLRAKEVGEAVSHDVLSLAPERERRRATHRAQPRERALGGAGEGHGGAHSATVAAGAPPAQIARVERWKSDGYCGLRLLGEMQLSLYLRGDGQDIGGH